MEEEKQIMYFNGLDKFAELSSADRDHIMAYLGGYFDKHGFVDVFLEQLEEQMEKAKKRGAKR